MDLENKYKPTISELTRLTMPLPLAVAKTKGVSLPSNPIKLDEAAMRHLIDMVASEMTEYVVAKTPAERIDAIVDALIYITDSAIRHGILHIAQLKNENAHSTPADVVSNAALIYRGMLHLFEQQTVEDQARHLNVMCVRLAYYAEDGLTPYVEEVARANNSKIADCGRVVLNESGKIMKPDGFIPPNLARIWDERHK